MNRLVTIRGEERNPLDQLLHCEDALKTTFYCLNGPDLHSLEFVCKLFYKLLNKETGDSSLFAIKAKYFLNIRPQNLNNIHRKEVHNLCLSFLFPNNLLERFDKDFFPYCHGLLKNKDFQAYLLSAKGKVHLLASCNLFTDTEYSRELKQTLSSPILCKDNLDNDQFGVYIDAKSSLIYSGPGAIYLLNGLSMEGEFIKANKMKDVYQSEWRGVSLTEQLTSSGFVLLGKRFVNKLKINNEIYVKLCAATSSEQQKIIAVIINSQKIVNILTSIFASDAFENICFTGSVVDYSVEEKEFPIGKYTWKQIQNIYKISNDKGDEITRLYFENRESDRHLYLTYVIEK